jgi:hypothetical protein
MVNCNWEGWRKNNSFSYFITMNSVHFSCTRFFYLYIIYSIYTYFKAWSVFHIDLLAIEIIACLILSYKKNNLEHVSFFTLCLRFICLILLNYLSILFQSRESHNWKTEWQREMDAETYEIKKSYICKRKTIE